MAKLGREVKKTNSYSNLIHQIEMGLKRGHSETEIVEAVIRAVNLGGSLRDMLEIKTHSLNFKPS